VLCTQARRKAKGYPYLSIICSLTQNTTLMYVNVAEPGHTATLPYFSVGWKFLEYMGAINYVVLNG
jgi:hypothetical protein